MSRRRSQDRQSPDELPAPMDRKMKASGGTGDDSARTPTMRPSARRSTAGRTGSEVAVKVLVSGGTFATAIAGILGAAGLWGYGDRVVLYALVTLSVLAALTLVTSALAIP